MYKWVLGDTDADAIEQADIGLAFIGLRPRQLCSVRVEWLSAL
jgi:hypothetical protein